MDPLGARRVKNGKILELPRDYVLDLAVSIISKNLNFHFQSSFFDFTPIQVLQSTSLGFEKLKINFL